MADFNPYGFAPNPYTYNPMLSYQMHMQNMNNPPQQMQQPSGPQNNQGYPNTQMQFQQPIGLKGRAVTGIEEARAAQIDFDGTIHYFPDTANGKIHTKQIGMNGVAAFNTYILQPPEAAVIPAPPIDVDKISAMENRIAELEAKIKEMTNNVQSGTNNGAAAKQRKSDADSGGNSK